MLYIKYKFMYSSKCDRREDLLVEGTDIFISYVCTRPPEGPVDQG